MSSIWWDINKCLSYDKLFNFIVGNRGGGKTFGCKKYVLNRFLKAEEQFVYVRRYDKELKLNTDIWRDLRAHYPNFDMWQKGQLYKINKEIVGYGAALSTSKYYKSVSFEGVTNIIFDEFIVEPGRQNYLKQEITKFLDFYETVARMREVRVFFLANAVASINPYFTYFNLRFPPPGKILTVGDCLVETVQKQDYIDAKKQTRFGKLIAESEYGRYAMENKFLLDEDSFVEKKSGNLRYMGTLMSDLGPFGMWQRKDGIIYISEQFEESNLVISVNLHAHDENTEAITTPAGRMLWNYLKGSFNLGYVRFETQRCKACFGQIYGTTLT